VSCAVFAVEVWGDVEEEESVREGMIDKVIVVVNVKRGAGGVGLALILLAYTTVYIAILVWA
jgi:hypothetical protein